VETSTLEQLQILLTLILSCVELSWTLNGDPDSQPAQLALLMLYFAFAGVTVAGILCIDLFFSTSGRLHLFATIVVVIHIFVLLPLSF
jgi:hypothetical protein